LVGGQLLTITIVTSSLPVVGICAGLDIRVAKLLSCFNLVFLVYFLVVLKHGLQNNLIITNHIDQIYIERCGCVSSSLSVYNRECDDDGGGCSMRFATLMFDLGSVLGLVFICWTTCTITAENESKYINYLSANRSADLVLNHILKNSIAGAATIIEVDISELDQNGEEAERLEEVLIELYRSMKWCASKQVKQKHLLLAIQIILLYGSPSQCLKSF
jgi:hypothetical protein